MTTQLRQMHPDQARDIILDWLIPATEDGTIDMMYQLFCEELAPYAVQIARRVLARKLGPDADLANRLRDDLMFALRVIEQQTPSKVSFGHNAELGEAIAKLQNWIRYLEDRRPTASEMELPPAWEEMLARGDSP